jgi:2-dehydropantoate 2-reductase
VKLFAAVVDEVASIASAQGVDLAGDIAVAKDALRQGAAIDGSRVASIRPSMLQDIEQGRPMEVEAILGQLQAFARDSHVASPALDVLVPLLRGLNMAVSA